MKMVASGNDFLIVDAGRSQRWNTLARNMCHRKRGLGADGLLVLEKSTRADVRMRVFNADGSEAEMCGNGARCVSWYQGCYKKKGTSVSIETKAGIIDSRIRGNIVRIRLTPPQDKRLNIPCKIFSRSIRLHFIDTGVPHVIVFVEDVNTVDVLALGNQIRFHKLFAPRGTNVNFVQVIRPDEISLRTYERGVEDETLACGTGAVASALITATQLCDTRQEKMRVHTKSGETLGVYFKRQGSDFSDVWLEGSVHRVYKGAYYV